MCIVLETAPLSERHGLMMIREEGRDGFCELDARCLERLAPFLGLARTLSIAARPVSSGVSTAESSGWCWGEVDSMGVLVDADNGLAAALRREWPRWQGPALPDGLWNGIRPMAGHCGSYKARYLEWRWNPLPHGVWLSVRHLDDPTPGLSARELEVANFYAVGRTYVEIASSLALAPATVRAHLRRIFFKLSVRNKVELARALHGQSARPEGASSARVVQVQSTAS